MRKKKEYRHADNGSKHLMLNFDLFFIHFIFHDNLAGSVEPAGEDGFFHWFISKRDLDEMNIEMIPNTLIAQILSDELIK